jgi:mono/diheme cytochrome c family protein
MISSVAALALLVLVGGATVIYLGVYNVAASEPHWPATRWLIETVRVRSIKAHAAGIVAPADLGTQTRIVAGTSHFSDHCVVCHAGPGVEADDMAEGMYPKPPALADAAKQYTPGELFWILKNGIKMTAMPSWGDHSDDDLWNTVAFIEKLPGMTHEEYGTLTAAAEAAGGHHMHGSGEMIMPGHNMPAANPQPNQNTHDWRKAIAPSERQRATRQEYNGVIPSVAKRRNIASIRWGGSFAPLSSHQVNTAM